MDIQFISSLYFRKKHSIFGSGSSKSASNPRRMKLTQTQMKNAMERTKLALAELKKGDGNLGREMLEQALDAWSV